MAKFLYQLAFNPTGVPNAAQVHVFLTQNRDVHSWYLAFPGNYLFKSERYLVELQTQFTQFFGQTQFTITYLQTGLFGGMLPQTIWQWANELDVPQITTGS